MDKTGLVVMVIILVVLAIASICYIFIDDLKNLFIGLTKKRRIASKLKKFAIDHDFPLLSDVVFEIREKEFIKIDHIMIGNKYIYVIACKTYYGYLNAKAIDEKWVLYKREKMLHVDNPLKNNEIRIKYLAKLLGNTSRDDFVNIIYLARPVVAHKIQGAGKKRFVIFEDDFEKFIETYEKECDLNEYSVKSVNEAAKSIYDYHKESLISYTEINVKKGE
jgi:hypothetical protein